VARSSGKTMAFPTAELHVHQSLSQGLKEELAHPIAPEAACMITGSSESILNRYLIVLI